MTTQPLKRNLFAILAADAVGYSRIMGENEEEAFRVLKAHRAVTDSIIELHAGRVFNTAGDSVLAAFESPVEAVRAAIEIQDAIKTRNLALPENRRLTFRIGVNLGDVIVKDNDLLGDAVNVAARLESQAPPGGLCISGTVYDQIVGKLDLQFETAGELTLKNIQRPVRAYMFGASGTPTTVAAAALPRQSSVRKPFTMMAGAIAFGALLVVGAAVLLLRPAQQVAAIAVPAAPAATAATTPQGKYDGMWRGTWCPHATEFNEAFCAPRVVRVVDGQLSADWGKPGEPGFMRMSGTVKDDGTVELSGSGVAGQGTNRGRPISVMLAGRIRGDVMMAKGKINDTREVDLNLARTQR